MTSLSRRKHQTTAPTRRTKASKRKFAQANIWLAVAAFAVLGQPFGQGTRADDYRAPARLAPNQDARPISGATARPIASNTQAARWSDVQKRQIGSSATVLRWRQPTVKPSVQQASTTTDVGKLPSRGAVSRATLTWGTDPTSPRKSSVRLVNQIGPLDPFDDPFGDRGTPIERPRNSRPTTPTGIQPVPEVEERPSVEVQPNVVEQPADSFPAPRELGDPPPNEFPVPPGEDGQANQFGDDDAPAPPEGLQPAQPEAELDPLLPIDPAEQSSGRPCNRIYNKRNCCTEGERCTDFRHQVASNTIQNISLDISPWIKPDADDATEEQQSRAIKLAESDIRSWRDRGGDVVARGQVVDLQFGRVHIEGDDGVAKIPVRQLSDDDWCFLAAWWGVPTECSLGDSDYQQREWLASTMTWKASALCHKPLYFEEVQLERYGHTAGPFLQPAVSGAHFFLNIAALPYKMGINPPNECRYALGYYRPGDCAPWLLPPVPLSVRGGLMEAGAIVGGIFVIP